MQRTLTDKIKNMLDFAKQGGKTLTGEPADEIDVHPSTSPGVREETLAERNKENQERKREWLIKVGRDKDHKSSTRAKKNARAALAKEETEDSSNSLDSYKPSPTNAASPAPPPSKKLVQNKNNKPSGIPAKPIGEDTVNEIFGNPERRTATQNMNPTKSSRGTSSLKPMSPEEKAKWDVFHNSLPPHMQASAKKNADLKAAEKARDLAPPGPPWDTKPDSKTSYVGPRKTFKDKFGNRISSPEHMARNLAKQGLEKALKDKNK